jgi:hypothetical protein
VHSAQKRVNAVMEERSTAARSGVNIGKFFRVLITSALLLPSTLSDPWPP